MTREDVVWTIFAAVDQVNKLLPEEMQVEKSVETPLFGPSGKLDSLGLINLIVTTEKQIEKEYGAVISLADEETISKVNEVFKTIGALAGYIFQFLTENDNPRT